MKRLTIFILLIASYSLFAANASAQTNADWYMAGANPQRTSWVSTEVTGTNLEWYRTLEAYISPKVQPIYSNGLVYISTSRGLYAFNANNGNVAWRFDTQLPLGHSPTVFNGTIYVGGFDKKLYALNATTGALRWAFTGAQAGYDTNPLVVEGKVILGNRDGYLYAIGAEGSSQPGQQLWRFPTGGQINYSAAYKDGVVYFASDDNYAYAVRTSDGSQVWKSTQLPSDGFHSYWPVIFRNLVIFSSSISYRFGGQPGTVEGFDRFHNMERDGVWPNPSAGNLDLGPPLPDQPWAQGYPLYPATKINNYHESKLWQRVVVALNQNNGNEYFIDTDNDGLPEPLPFTYWGTHSGNRYPPLVGPDNILYSPTIYTRKNTDYWAIPNGRVVGWNPDSPNALKVFSSTESPHDEPISLSMGGNYIYRDYQDSHAHFISINSSGPTGRYWNYSSPNTLTDIAPGYKDMISYPDGGDWYGVYGSPNGIYGFGGDQAALVPANNHVYALRGTTLLAFGNGSSLGRLPTLAINPTTTSLSVPSTAELKSRLETEIQKIVAAGHLRPGYLNHAQFNDLWASSLTNYFENPGETLSTLSLAYPHLSSSLQNQLKTYLDNEFNRYFDPTMKGRVGWADGAARDSTLLPPEIQASLASYPDQISVNRYGWSWNYPQINFYGMWKYAQLYPGNQAKISRIYDLAKSNLEVPASATTDDLIERTWELNGYLTGYKGFLQLQTLAGMAQTDAALRTQVTNEYNHLLQFKVSSFTQDSPWIQIYEPHRRFLNIARNFMYLSPEVGSDLRSQLLTTTRTALTEYDRIAPYWFATRYEAAQDEGIISPLYNVQALFQAKAWILNDTREELYKYLDAPAFPRGDLFYIQNLVALIEAPSDGSPTATPGPSAPPPSQFDFADLWDRLLVFGTNNTLLNLVGTSSLIDIFDFNYLVRNL